MALLPGLGNGRLQLFVDGLPPLEIEGLETDEAAMVAIAEGRDRSGRSMLLEVVPTR